MKIETQNVTIDCIPDRMLQNRGIMHIQLIFSSIVIDIIRCKIEHNLYNPVSISVIIQVRMEIKIMQNQP